MRVNTPGSPIRRLDQVIDNNFDYKEEALIYFVGILENNKVLDSETDRGELQGGKTGKEVD
jgi:hypothetical protein